MKAIVVYESMYGNTHLVADAIGRGLATSGEVVVVPVADAAPALVEDADLLVVGGPTHAHGMSRPSTRKAAVEQAKDNPIDPAAAGAGVREWLETLPPSAAPSAAFDTRAGVAPALLTGRASKGIAKQLHQHGFAPGRRARELPGRQGQPPRARRGGAGRGVGGRLAAVVTSAKRRGPAPPAPGR